MEWESREEYLETLCSYGALALEETEDRGRRGLREETARIERAAAEAEEKELFLPLEYLLRIFRCDRIQRCFVRLLCAMELNPHILKKISWDRIREKDLRTVLAGALEIGGAQVWRSVRQPGFCRVFLEHGGKGEEVALEERILYFAVNGAEIYRGYEGFSLAEEEVCKETSAAEDEGCDGVGQQSLQEISRKGYGVRQLEKLYRLWKKGEQEGVRSILFYLTGSPLAGKEEAAAKVCRRLGERASYLDMDCRDEEFFLLLRECRIFQCVPVLKGGSWEEADRGKILMALEAFSVVFLTAERYEHLNLEQTEVYAIDFPIITAREMEEAWLRALPAGSRILESCVSEISGKYILYPRQIEQIIREARLLAAAEGKNDMEKRHLEEGCLRILDPPPDKRAVRVNRHYGWEDLVLPRQQKELLKAACGQVIYKRRVYEDWGMQEKLSYGRGVSMILSGPPGTGKTMAAQVLAGWLGMSLYRIELSSVISKYIGETEKNLEQIFEMAEKSQGILFFDEADALFSKRTEVKEANDRYNNLEAAFLLQKMESYEGITILATNYIQNFDEAFKRRMKFLIEFPFPNEEQRRKIWEKCIPGKMPTGALDLDFLAGKFSLSGGNIRNAVVYAAFLAAGEGTDVEMRHMIKAVKNEYAKSGKTVTREEAGEYYMHL